MKYGIINKKAIKAEKLLQEVAEIYKNKSKITCAQDVTALACDLVNSGIERTKSMTLLDHIIISNEGQTSLRELPEWNKERWIK